MAIYNNKYRQVWNQTITPIWYHMKQQRPGQNYITVEGCQEHHKYWIKMLLLRLVKQSLKMLIQGRP